MNVWKTGHQICDKVAESLANGFDTKAIHVREWKGEDNSIAYGILRGTGDIFRSSRRWFHVDNGYFNPGHFDGYYRISYRGTQACYMVGIEADIALRLKPWRRGERVMIVPPTPHVASFFDIDVAAWLKNAIGKCNKPYFIKIKDGSPVIFDGVDKIITFNSSLGWQGLIEGIEVDSDPRYSTVGSYYASKAIDGYRDFMHIDREPLFRFMRAMQFKLSEIENGDASWLINYPFISAGTHEKQSLPISPPIVF